MTKIEIFNKRLLVNIWKKFDYDTRVFSRSLQYNTRHLYRNQQYETTTRVFSRSLQYGTRHVYRNLQYKTTTRVFCMSLQQETSIHCKIIDNLFQWNKIEVFSRRLNTVGNRWRQVSASAPLIPNEWFIIGIKYISAHQHTTAPTGDWYFIVFVIKYTSAHWHSSPPKLMINHAHEIYIGASTCQHNFHQSMIPHCHSI